MMFDCSAQLAKFYNDHVRLGSDRRQMLAGHRDANLDRLSDGLAKISEDDGKTYENFIKSFNQGSYAMHTLNQHPDNDYDIDVGVLFDAADVPASPLEARKRVARAIASKADGFAKEPEARTNAVTVWYAAGHHVDFAVYRRRTLDSGQEVIEHAGTEWKARNPLEMNEWFAARVASLSPLPGGGATVALGQLRRIVRLVKAFANSRQSWSLPGGMVVTTLVCECYRPSAHRDDVALYDTLAALLSRLRVSTSVVNPVESGAELTSKAEVKNQVVRLRDKLADNLPRLDILFDPDCTEAKARSAWDWIFNHEFWAKDLAKSAQLEGTAPLLPLKVDVGVTSHQNGPVRFPYRDKPLPKRMWLRFALVKPPISEPYMVRWLVKNEGDEAAAVNEMTHETTGPNRTVHWESTAYKGNHQMICEVRKDGALVARGVKQIKIAAR